MNEDHVARLFLEESAEILDQASIKIRHCLGQLTAAQIGWRPHPNGNSIGNLILHICGNLRQWTLAGVGGQSDTRDRKNEFDCREVFAADSLVRLMDLTVSEAQALIDSLSSSQLVERRSIQGFDVTVLQAIHHTTTHFVGHTHQIIYITRMILGDKYQMRWSPEEDRGKLPI